MTRRKDPQPETSLPEMPLSQTAGPEPFAVEVEAVNPPELRAPDPDPRPDPPPRSPPPRRSGILGPLLGGALAAIGGFALSHFNVFGLAAPDTSAAVTAVATQLDAATAQQTTVADKLGADIAALDDRLATLEATPTTATVDPSRLDALDQRLATIEAMPTEGGATTAALTAKLADLEQRLATQPTGGSDAALQRQLDEALVRLNAAEAAASARAAEAEAAAATARRDKALAALSEAIATGQPFAAELQALADPTLAQALGSMAGTGVPTLALLQADFPAPARESLLTARKASNEDGWTNRLVDFLATQTGARSLTPREGADPDAILSRAEFALSEGRVADALAELQPLDPAVKAPLDGWSAQASTYLAATAALQAARGE
jgi:hypothetical protein